MYCECVVGVTTPGSLCADRYRNAYGRMMDMLPKVLCTKLNFGHTPGKYMYSPTESSSMKKINTVGCRPYMM